MTGFVAGGIAGALVNPIEGAILAAGGGSLAGTLGASTISAAVGSGFTTAWVESFEQLGSTGSVDVGAVASKSARTAVVSAFFGAVGSGVFKGIPIKAGGGEIRGFIPNSSGSSGLRSIIGNATPPGVPLGASTALGLTENFISDSIGGSGSSGAGEGGSNAPVLEMDPLIIYASPKN